jgi:hypothetical protein
MANDRWDDAISELMEERRAEIVEPIPLPIASQDAVTIANETIRNAISVNPYRQWATKPKSQFVVNRMFHDPPMLEEIEIARKNGYIVGTQWISENKRLKS